MRDAIVLIGMAGSGKTTVGRQVARLLGRPFLDVDDIVAERFGPIPELFKHGEPHFRACEAAAVEDACRVPGAVIATGGGVVTQPACMEALARAGTVFFLDRGVEGIAADIDFASRPLLAGGAEALRAMHAGRLPLYRKYADHVVPNDGDAGDACRRIIEIVREGKP